MKSLYEELMKYGESDYYPFHMPGHKRRVESSSIYKIDITEIDGFDNLHHAEGLLLELQKKAAKIYHAEESFYLINGSTGGILSAIAAVAEKGKKLLMARNCHKSVYNAVLLNRLETEYLWPEVIEDFDIQGEIRAEKVEEILKKNNDFCAFVLTSPTYEGVISDIEKIAEIVHRYQIPLIVDEAHGAHLVLSGGKVKGAIECGADIVINSVHKTLPAMTQTALLHIQGNLVDRKKLKKNLSIYQSSSPSYVLMASIDECMNFMLEQGQERYERLLKLREKIDGKTKDFSGIRIFPAGETHDPGKLFISVKGTEITGQELYRVLLEEYHLQMEMASPTGVLGILTVMDSEEGVDRLLNALKEIDDKLSVYKKEGAKVFSELSLGNVQIPETRFSIYDAEQQNKEWLPADKAAGKISGEFIYLYPPGIPLIVPGEVLEEKMIQGLNEMRIQEFHMIGLSEKGEYCVLGEGCV